MTQVPQAPTILVIDDNAANLGVLTGYLRRRGFRLIIARDSADGIEKARLGQPDLILLAVMMPDRDGFETCRDLKADPETKEIPVIFITALQSVEDKVKGFTAGGVDYLTKPLQAEEVLARVQTHVHIRALQQQLAEQNRRLQQESGERKQTEQALRAREEIFRSMFERHSAVMLLIDPDTGQIINANHAAAQFYGYALAALQQMRITQINQLSPEDVSQAMQVAKVEHRNFFEFRHRLADGQIREVEVHSTPITFEGQTVLFSIVHDITERKRAEDALRASRANLLALMDNTSDRVWAIDAAYHLVYANAEFEREFHANIGIHLSPGMNLLDITPDALRPAWQARYDRALHGERFLFEEQYHFQNRIMSMEIALTPIIAEGAIIGVSCFSHDITDRKRAEAELRQAKDAAEAANQVKSRFLASISHELRTPLNSILGFAYLLSHNQTLAPEQQEQAATIHRSGTQLLALINDILELSRSEAGRTTVNPRHVRLYHFLDELSDLFRLHAAAKHLQLTFTRAPDVPPDVHLDKVKLRQVLVNLIGNAVKFTEQGNVNVRVSELDEFNNSETHKLCFEVEDTGPGIPAERLAALFQAFEKNTAEANWREGVGLGLALSSQLVQVMGGALTVNSTVGQGTTFTVSLPYDLECLNADHPLVIDAPPAAPESAPPGEQSFLSPPVLAALPAPLLENLKAAAITGDIDAVGRLIADIRPYDAAFADKLAGLAKHFDYGKILTFLKQRENPAGATMKGENYDDGTSAYQHYGEYTHCG